ncbi:hypothetical protein [Pseudonocardia sp. HH130630-07]|uniref:hypothetical protein n=1 Tax=Pseudonocardia sp. HH130630-07 TaxID=1690815 RepID=UPI0012EABD7C|nr:hypothetical protein [Pseudonocardia sp. HH130630-07]
MTEIGDRVVTWHNGGTGGHRTMLALDREAGEAVVVLNDTDRWIDEQAIALLRGGTATGGPEVGTVGWTTAAAMVVVLAGSVAMLLRPRSRLYLLGAVALGLFALTVLLVSGPWAVVPGAVWTGAAAAWLACAGLGARRWPALPGGSGGLRTAGDVVTLVFGAVLLAAAVVTA